MPPKTPFTGALILLSMIPLYGCSSTPVKLDTAKHEQIIKEDRQNIQGNQEVQQDENADKRNIPKNIALSINEALDIALEENLDARVSALEYIGAQDSITLEKIRALPSLEYNVSRTGRSNLAASSSRSILTGNESLEPSVSSDRYRSTRDITARLNLIDTAAILMDVSNASDRAEIAKERHKKVIQNIHRDVRSAYWRAYDNKQNEQDTQELIAKTDAHLKNIDIAVAEKLISKTQAYQQKTAYNDAITALKTLQNESALATIELKSLLNLPQSTNIKLTSKPDAINEMANKLINADLETIELTALRSRPEMREAFIEKNISIRDTKKEIVRSLPGAELFFALNRDTNSFLANESWRSYSISLVQNIANLLSLPDRFQIARKTEELNETRRVTLAAAILAQVHIARHNLINAKELEALTTQEQEAAQFRVFAVQKQIHAGRLPKSQILLTRLQAQETKLQAQQSIAAAQDAYAAFINTLGQDIGETVKLSDKKKAGVS